MRVRTQTSNLTRQINASVIAGWVLFWIFMIAVEIQDYQRGHGTRLWQPILWQTSSAVVISLIIYLLRPTFSNRTLLSTPRRWFARALLIHPLVCIFFVVLVFALRHLVYRVLGEVYTHEAWPEVFLYETIKLTLFLSLFYVIYFGVQSYALLIEERDQAAQALKLLQQAQLQRLTQQMQPHFLFNALNTISSLMYSDLKAADTAMSRLAELLRASLELNEKNATSLEQELHMLRAYADLMAMRFMDRVAITWEIDPVTLSCQVPVMCLQTILENSFKHTVEKHSGLTRILIRARLVQDSLTLSIEDDIGQLDVAASSASNDSGIGTRNLSQRLLAMYGESSRLRMENLAPRGVITEIRIPQ